MEPATFSVEDFAELRRQVAATADHHGFWDYFFISFVDRPGFFNLGEATEVPGAAAVLAAVAGYMLNQAPIPPRNLTLVEIPGGIVHGSCLFDGRVCAVIYVPALDTGLIAIMGPGGVMSYSRFLLQSEREARAAVC